MARTYTLNEHRSISKNPNRPAGRAAMANHARQVCGNAPRNGSRHAQKGKMAKKQYTPNECRSMSKNPLHPWGRASIANHARQIIRAKAKTENGGLVHPRSPLFYTRLE